MKNLDIEKIERQNLYKIPEDFFENMQENVLLQTARKKKAKIVRINWTYSAAAAIAFLIGIGFFINQNDSDILQIHEKNVANKVSTPLNNAITERNPQNIAELPQNNAEDDLTSLTENDQKGTVIQNDLTKGESNSIVKSRKETIQNPEVQVDQILANFTSAELADLGKNTEQDIYLDLYN